MALLPIKHYFTEDGTYGDALAMVVLPTRNFTYEEWEWIDATADSDRMRMAITCFVRSFYRERNGHDSGLPCEHCHFTEDETTDSGYVWIVCGADRDGGCDWGNR